MAKLLKKHFTGKDIFMQHCNLSQEKKRIKHEDGWINNKEKNLWNLERKDFPATIDS